jgi:hypothetical protein
MRQFKFPKALVQLWNCREPPDGEVILTEQEIMEGMGQWDYYKAKMKEVGKEDQIDYNGALDSFVVCHWGGGNTKTI